MRTSLRLPQCTPERTRRGLGDVRDRWHRLSLRFDGVVGRQPHHEQHHSAADHRDPHRARRPSRSTTGIATSAATTPTSVHLWTGRLTTCRQPAGGPLIATLSSTTRAASRENGAASPCSRARDHEEHHEPDDVLGDLMQPVRPPVPAHHGEPARLFGRRWPVTRARTQEGVTRVPSQGRCSRPHTSTPMFSPGRGRYAPESERGHRRCTTGLGEHPHSIPPTARCRAPDRIV